MAEIDPNIALQARPVQFENPMDIQAKALQIRQLGLQTQAQQRDFQNQQTLADLYRQNIGPDGSVDHPAIISAMAKSGLGAQIPAYQKSLLDVTKTKADIGETVAKTSQANASTTQTQLETSLKNVQNVGAHIYSLAQDPNLTHDSAYAAINSWVNQGVIDPQQGAQIARTLPGDPAALKSYMLQKATEGLGIEQQIKAKLDSLPKPVYEDTGAQKVGIDTNPLTNGGKLPTLQKTMTPDEAAKIKLQTSGALTDDAKSFMIDRLLNGEKASAVLGNLGRGAQGAADLRDVMNRLPQVAAQRGIGGAQIANIMQNTAADARTLTELGAREGKIAPRVQELANFVDQARVASAAVPRGNWTDATSVLQWGAKHSSDPALAKLQTAVDGVINARAAAIGGGVIHVNDQIEGHKLLAAAQGQDAFSAVMDQFQKEASGALDAPGQVRARLNAGAGRTDSAGPPVPVKSDADFNALKSGTRFTAPDGTVRVKP